MGTDLYSPGQQPFVVVHVIAQSYISREYNKPDQILCTAHYQNRNIPTGCETKSNIVIAIHHSTIYNGESIHYIPKISDRQIVAECIPARTKSRFTEQIPLKECSSRIVSLSLSLKRTLARRFHLRKCNNSATCAVPDKATTRLLSTNPRLKLKRDDQVRRTGPPQCLLRMRQAAVAGCWLRLASS